MAVKSNQIHAWALSGWLEMESLQQLQLLELEEKSRLKMSLRGRRDIARGNDMGEGQEGQGWRCAFPEAGPWAGLAYESVHFRRVRLSLWDSV